MFQLHNNRRALSETLHSYLVIVSLLIAFVLIAPACGAVVAQQGKLPAQQRAQFERAISKFMSETKAPGVSVAVVEDGEMVWSAGFGKADIENKIAATPETLYRLGSISKSLTATGAMQLWEAGKLDLDAPVQKYCPAFPQKEFPITTRELLGHLGGIRHYNSGPDDLETENTKHFDDPIAGGLHFFAKDPLVAKPGTKFHYSTQGYTLVGCVMEGASSEKYVAYMEEHVIAPADMTETQPDNALAKIPNRTGFYSKDRHDAVVSAHPLDSSYKIPGGGWLSSANEMARFEIAILDDRLVRRATRDIMWTPQKDSEGRENGYALGWDWKLSKEAGVPEVSHDGAQQGTSTFIAIAPDLRAGVVVLINMDHLQPEKLGIELMKAIASSSGVTQSQAH